MEVLPSKNGRGYQARPVSLFLTSLLVLLQWKQVGRSIFTSSFCLASVTSQKEESLSKKKKRLSTDSVSLLDRSSLSVASMSSVFGIDLINGNCLQILQLHRMAQRKSVKRSERIVFLMDSMKTKQSVSQTAPTAFLY